MLHVKPTDRPLTWGRKGPRPSGKQYAPLENCVGHSLILLDII